MSSKLGWRLLLLLSLAHKVIAEMKNAPEGAFLHAFLAEWTSASAMIYNASSGTDNQILYYEYVISLTHIALSNIIKKHIY